MKHGLDRFRSSIFNAVLPKKGFFSGKFDPKYPMLSPLERDEGIDKLQQSLPSGNDVIYRGTEGTAEVMHAVESDRLGVAFQSSKKMASFDIVDFVRENNSKYFLSASPCPQTVKPYAAGLSLIPCKGFIWVTGLPKVFTLPQKLLHLNPGLFEQYDQRKLSQQDQDNPTRYDSIKGMTRNNNEVTIVLGGADNEDWRPRVSKDVMKLIQVSGPGSLMGQFMSSNEPVHVTDWNNPEYKKRVWSMEIVLSDGRDYADNLEDMNARAREMGLITPDQRLLTLQDARAVVNSKKLDPLDTEYETNETHKIIQVPKGIAIGDTAALVEYMLHDIKSGKNLVEMMAEERRAPDL